MMDYELTDVETQNAVAYKEKWGMERPKPLIFRGESKVRPEFKDEMDLNNILKKYQSRDIPEALKRQGVFADYSSFKDLGQHLENIQSVQERFDLLPSATREKFQNDPVQMLDFLQDSNNDAESVKLGLKPNINSTLDASSQVAETTQGDSPVEVVQQETTKNPESTVIP
jgi:phage internal scaffolding protein